MKKKVLDLLISLVKEKIDYCEEHQDRCIGNEPYVFWQKKINVLNKAMYVLNKKSNRGGLNKE